MDLYGNMLSRVLFPLFEAARRRPTVALTRELEHSQWSSPDRLRERQVVLLRRLLGHAHDHTPYYRAILDERGIDPTTVHSLADLHRLPLLDRATVRATLEARTADHPRWTIQKATSGTTGEPVTVRYGAESRHWRDATRWRGYGWAGYRIGMRALHYWGISPLAGSAFHAHKAALDHKLKRDRYVDCTPRGDEALMRAVRTVQEFQPEVMVAYASGAAALARFVIDHHLRSWRDLPVIVGAERLWPHDRLAIAEAFGPAFETYGSREVMLMAAECEQHDGLHTSMETMVVELVVRDPDGTTRAARPGETGEVAVTDLHNLECPMIRYVTGDLAVARDDEPCACGRGLVRIGPIEGRVTETLHDGRGNPVSGLVFNILFGVLDQVARQFQVVQRRDGSVVMKVVASDPPRLPDHAERAVYEVAARYLPDTPFAIEYVEDIAPSAAGKRTVVIVERPEAPS